jgi:hypothetical protein
MPQAPVEFKDVIVEPRYDTLTAVTGSTILTFFQNPIGQGTGNFGAAGSSKTLADTNMDLPGQLPAGYSFRIMGFRMAFVWSITMADVASVFNGAVFSFVVGSKPFVTVPARTIPSGNAGFVSGNAGSTAAANVAVGTSGWPMMGNSFSTTTKPLDLKATENFKVALSWPGTTPTVTSAGFQTTPGLPITIYLDGFLYRPVQ